MKNDNKKLETEGKSLLIESEHLKKQKKNIHKYDSIGINTSTNVLAKQKKKKREKCLQRKKDTRNDNNKSDQDNKSDNQLPGILLKLICKYLFIKIIHKFIILIFFFIKVLEAGDVKSLLEQFEASESTLVSNYPPVRINREYELDTSIKSNEIQQCIKQSQISNLHKNIRDALPKEVVENIKVIM